MCKPNLIVLTSKVTRVQLLGHRDLYELFSLCEVVPSQYHQVFSENATNASARIIPGNVTEILS